MTRPKLNPNWLYQNHNFSTNKSKALQRGYPWSLTYKEYTALPRECDCGHLGLNDGIRLMLDTREPSQGFVEGNAVWHCKMHLGNQNKELRCSNSLNLIDHANLKPRRKDFHVFNLASKEV